MPSQFRSSSIHSIEQSLLQFTGANDSVAVHVQGSTPSSRAFLLSRLARPGQIWIIVCSDSDAASAMAADLSTFCSTQELPGWEQSPYSGVAPSIQTRNTRIAALSALHSMKAESPPLVLVTHPAALGQASIPPAKFRDSGISLKLNQSIQSREELARRLTEAGYLRTDPVEDPGSFAVRGEIIDVFPPGFENPVRIELFDDVIEKMRPFDRSNQRTLPAASSLESVQVPPAREVLNNSETRATLKERVKDHADHHGIPRSKRDPIMEEISSGLAVEDLDAWGPFAYTERSDFWDHLNWAVKETGCESRVVWNDELALTQEWDGFIEEQERLFSEALESKRILPEAKVLFGSDPLRDSRTLPFHKLFLDQIALTQSTGDTVNDALQEQSDEIKSQHQVWVRANSDISGRSRSSLEDLEPKFRQWLAESYQVFLLSSTQSQLERMRFLLEERNIPCSVGALSEAVVPGRVALVEGEITEGFRWPAERLVIITEREVLGTQTQRKGSRRSSGKQSAAKDWSGLQDLSDLSPGDAVVHVDHGIGLYQGLVRLDVSGAPSDFLLLEYANKDKLYLPVYRLNVIQKYAGSGSSVALDKLGGQQFAKEKARVKEAVKTLAFDLVQLYAQRQLRPGIRFNSPSSEFREFEAKFPFDETADQLKAIDDIVRDMESGRAMDRVVCGDVGYGKTEVAMRAAFLAVSEGRQVAVLVPTTVLAHQHELSFRARFKDYPFVIDGLSRFKSAKDQKAALQQAKEGKVDILIGTHRLLSKDVEFKDLALVIVDEEHRFGVEHKERLKTLRINAHFLTLTATPIPRTLHMALSGLRDISLINTPPVNRLPIRTYVAKFDEHLIARAIDTELNRGGQVFFVHNRVQTIQDIASRLREISPHARIGIGHAQMSDKELEDAMMSFYRKETNVLLCTTIIESGLDIPSANTIIVNRADAFGLAQLYQIRGRVGRGQQRAYAYLLLPAEYAITEDARKRIEVIQKFVELGSGFSVASHDLEIRGGGDLLGPQQSGHIAAVGFELYTELLEEAIHEIQGKESPIEQSAKEPEIKVPYAAFLPEMFVPDIHQRLSLYRRLSASENETTLTSLEEELADRFGPLPEEARNLLWLIRTKQLLKAQGVEALTVGPGKASFLPGSSSRLDPAKAIALVSSQPADYQLMPDSKFVAKLRTDTFRDLYFAAESLLKKLAVATR